jgi:uncharacterized protein (TIGR03067 family)
MGRHFRHRSDISQAIPASKAGLMSKNSEKDLALLQGAWEQVRHESNGVAISEGDMDLAGTCVTFAGNDFTVTSANGEVILKGSVLLDVATIPRQVTWIRATGPDTGKPISAIYTVSEDEFVFVYARDGGAKPTGFHADAGQAMRRFVRRPLRFS